MNNLIEKAITFKEIERIFYEMGCEVVQAVGKRQTEAEKKLVEAFEDNELS